MADAAGWNRFTRVTDYVPSGHKLYRASSPNYKNRDSDQDLTQEAVDFLVSHGIDSIISFNEFEYSATEMKRLADATPPIQYLHLKLGDFKPPTLAQFSQANAFFLQNRSTLVHCGFGWGRTGTGVTGIQIYAENGKTLQPLASLWSMPLIGGGNNVEKREQMSALSELRNTLLPRVEGTVAGDVNEAFAIINFATGYYMTLSADKRRVLSVSPETVEVTPSIHQSCQWVVSKDGQGEYTLANKFAAGGFALTNPQEVDIDAPVMYGTQSEENMLFSITEAASDEKGCYIISPKLCPNLAVAIQAPDNVIALDFSILRPALLSPNDIANKFGLWILLPASFHG